MCIRRRVCVLADESLEFGLGDPERASRELDRPEPPGGEQREDVPSGAIEKGGYLRDTKEVNVIEHRLIRAHHRRARSVKTAPRQLDLMDEAVPSRASGDVK